MEGRLDEDTQDGGREGSKQGRKAGRKMKKCQDKNRGFTLGTRLCTTGWIGLLLIHFTRGLHHNHNRFVDKLSWATIM